MASNRRKTYGGDSNGASDAPKPCPKCGCRHFYAARAAATTSRVRIVRTCRNCGFETVETA